MEHIFATSSIVQNALHHGLPLSVTFLDLKNAFGSVSHQLIADMLDHVGVPIQLGSYISSAYSQLSAYVVSKKWSTPTFSIHRGVFQGDTLSLLIFLIAFNPIIQLAQSLSTLGFRLRLPDANQCELPKENSYLWNEESSEEPNGWYPVKSPQSPLMARPRCTIVRANPMRISISMTLNGLQLRAMENGSCHSLVHLPKV